MVHANRVLARSRQGANRSNDFGLSFERGSYCFCLWCIIRLPTICSAINSARPTTKAQRIARSRFISAFYAIALIHLLHHIACSSRWQGAAKSGFLRCSLRYNIAAEALDE